MKGKTILNSLKHTETIEFSEAIPIKDDALYFAFRIKTTLVPIESSRNPKSILADILKRDKVKYTASEVSAEPIAYIKKLKLKENTYEYIIEPLNDNHADYIKENKKEILIELLGRQNISDYEIIDN